MAFSLVRLKKEFDLLYKRGKTAKGSFFSLRFLENKHIGDKTRFGIVISTKVSKKAVERNRKRRQLKEIIRLNQDKIKDGYIALIIFHELGEDFDYKELEKEFLGLVNKAGILK